MAALVSAAAIAAEAIGPAAGPVYAATPPMLHYRRAAGAPPAGDLLRQLAGTAGRSAVKGSGGYQYLHTRQWLLLDPRFSSSTGWTVEPSEAQTWRKVADDSGRQIRRLPGAPANGAPEELSYGPGGLAFGIACAAQQPRPAGQPCSVDGLADSANARRALQLDGRYVSYDQTGRMSPLGIVASLAEHYVLPPKVRAQLWQVLAGLPGISYTGRVTDRAGRTGEAFSLDFNAETGPTRDTLIIDPATGEPLGYERILAAVTNPRFFDNRVPGYPTLRLRTPAVVSYAVLLESELRPTDH